LARTQLDNIESSSSCRAVIQLGRKIKFILRERRFISLALVGTKKVGCVREERHTTYIIELAKRQRRKAPRAESQMHFASISDEERHDKCMRD